MARLARLSAAALSLPAPKSRSKSEAGSTSLGTGVVSLRQAIFETYAQLYPESQFPAVCVLSKPSSSDGNRVIEPILFAASWSTEIPSLMLAPEVLYGCAPVKNAAADL